MRRLLVCMWLAIATPIVPAQQARELALEQHPFRLYSAFWPNLHHVLWAEAWARRPSTEEKAAGALPEPLTANLSAAERRAWEAAVSHYDAEIADLHLLFEMGQIRKRRFARLVNAEWISRFPLPGFRLSAPPVAQLPAMRSNLR